jgi:hypothetical protein
MPLDNSIGFDVSYLFDKRWDVIARSGQLLFSRSKPGLTEEEFNNRFGQAVSQALKTDERQVDRSKNIVFSIDTDGNVTFECPRIVGEGSL